MSIEDKFVAIAFDKTIAKIRKDYDTIYLKGIQKCGIKDYPQAEECFYKWLLILEKAGIEKNKFYCQAWTVLATIALLKNNKEEAVLYLVQNLLYNKQDLWSLERLYLLLREKETIDKIEIINIIYKNKQEIIYIYNFLYQKKDNAAFFYRQLLWKKYNEKIISNIILDYYVNKKYNAAQKENINILLADYLFLLSIIDNNKRKAINLIPDWIFSKKEGDFSYEQREIYDKIKNICKLIKKEKKMSLSGRAKKKMKNKNLLNQKNEQKELINIEKEQLNNFLKERKFNAAMELIIKLFENGNRSPELMLDLSKIYYYTGDYLRARNWAVNAYNNNLHKPAEFLLSKIHIAEKKYEDAAYWIDKFLSSSIDSLSNKEKEELEEIVFSINVHIDLGEKYKNILRWENNQNKLSDAVTAVKDDLLISRSKGTIGNIADDSLKEIEDLPDNVVSSDGFKNRVLTEQTLDNLDRCPSLEQGGGSIKSSNNECEAYILLHGIKEIDDLEKSISEQGECLIKRIDTYNRFATYFFSKRDLEKAKVLLENALKIDNKSQKTLENLLMVAYVSNDFSYLRELLPLLPEDTCLVTYLKRFF